MIFNKSIEKILMSYRLGERVTILLFLPIQGGGGLESVKVSILERPLLANKAKLKLREPRRGSQKKKSILDRSK